MKNKPNQNADAVTEPEMPGLSLLKAELEALSILMPGLEVVLPGHVPPTETEVEEGFDNMPV